MQNEIRLIDANALKKEVEELVVGGAKGLKDYYENGSKSDENSWIGGVYDAWELIDLAPTVKEISVIEFKEPLPLVKAHKIVKALEERPQGDLISRSALKEVITANHYLLSAKNNSVDYGMFTTGIIQAIDNAQPIEIATKLQPNCNNLQPNCNKRRVDIRRR